MSRQEANLLILGILKKFLEENPDARFHQALFSLGLTRTDSLGLITDDFYTESEEVLSFMKNGIEKQD